MEPPELSLLLPLAVEVQAEAPQPGKPATHFDL